MKIQIASDLHLEWLARQFPGCPPLAPAPEAELLVLAGDIHHGTKALDAFKDWPVPVVYVAGNHEFYGLNLYGTLDALKASASGSHIHFLEHGEWRLPGVRFLGVTLWTDYALDGQPEKAKALAGVNLADHRWIEGRVGALFSPADALERHRTSLLWLKAALSNPFEGKTVVVTHHGVHPQGVAPQFKGSLLNGAFFSDLRSLLPLADLWVHGHTHSRVDIQEGRCRVVANPRGYPLNVSMAAGDWKQLRFENPQFSPTWVIEV